MAEAASETHLLREAEQYLGEKIWERVENVEELGIEYWNLRRLVTERDELAEKLKEAEVILETAHDQRAEILNQKSEKQDNLSQKRTELLAELERLAAQRDDVVFRARNIRRLYDGIKTKLDVLKSEARDDDETLKKAHARMKELRDQFDALKEERSTVAQKITDDNKELDKVEELLDSERGKHREDAAQTFQMIGEANRKISSYKAEIGLIETEMRQLFGEIGRHVSRNTKTSQPCKEATSDVRPMVDVMSALRRSINLNHRLAGI